MRWQLVFGVIKKSVIGWCCSNSFQHGAALAYYATFSLAPMLFIVIAIAGWLYGEEAAQGQLKQVLVTTLQPSVAEAIAEMLTHVHVSGFSPASTTISVALIVFAVTSMFIQLRVAINDIWGIEPKPGQGIWTMIRSRLLAFLLLLGLGLLLFLLVVGNAALVAVRQLLPDTAWADWANSSWIWAAVFWALLLTAQTLLFAMIYQLLPDAWIGWRETLVGSFITALLLSLGNYLIGLYLGNMAPNMGYWAASSLILLMLWVYYSSQVLLFGAEITQNLAAAWGRPVRPSDNAIYQPSRTSDAPS